MQSDAAIKRIEDDKFDRTDFAKTLAKALQLPEGSEGLVVAIEGEWGTGKTVIFNFIEEFIRQQNKQALVVRFDPWLISGLDTLCQGFFVQLATALNNIPGSDIANKAAKRVLSLAKFLGPIKLIPGVEPWGTIVENVISSVGNSALAAANIMELDLNKRKKEVEESIIELKAPIIVMIDDIDRLRPEEVRTIFQLVKAVGNFRRVSYLLAYDPDAIHKALEADGIPNGKEYLEKIVQVPYTIPKLRYVQKKRYLDVMLKAFITRYDISLGVSDRERIKEALSAGGVTHALRHPRDINRLINKLRISAIATQGEVSFADVFVFETLAICYSHVVGAVRKRPFDFIKAHPEEDFLMGNYDFIHRPIGGAPATEWPEWKKDLFKSIGDSERNILLSLLVFLFPDFGEKHSVPMPQNPEAELRVCAAGPLMKLLSVGQAEGIPSAIEVKSFLRNKENRKEFIDGAIEDDMVAVWLDALSCHAEMDSLIDPEELCDLTFYAVLEEYKLHNNDVVEYAAKFLRRIIDLRPRESEKHDLFKKVVSNTQCLTLAHDVILDAVKEHGKWVINPGSGIDSEKRLIKSWEVVEQGTHDWLRAVKTKSQDHEEFLKELNVLSILYRWGQLKNNDYTEVRQFIVELTKTDDGITNFVKLWRPGVSFSGLELLIGDKNNFMARIDKHTSRNSFEEFAQYVSSIGKE